MAKPTKNSDGELVFSSEKDLQAYILAQMKAAGFKPGKKTRTPQTDFDTELSKIPGLNKQITDSFKKMGGVIDKIFGAGGTAFGGLEEFGAFGKNKYDAIQEQFGGIRDIDKAATESARTSVQAIDDIYANFLGNAGNNQNMMIEINGEMVNAASAFYEDQEDIANNYLAIRAKLAGRQSTMFNKMSREDQTKIAMMERGFQISNDKVSQLLERQISTTGEASNKIFDEMAAYSSAVAEETGISFQAIAQGVANIITDVQRFGNVQVDEATRIAAALDQLGMSYEGFGGMVDQFMNFDTAAQSLGNLTTVFGVHFDAMEMMQLANEDQEEFLHRMRDAFLDSGKAIEDMTLAEKKLASQQLGMSIQDFENFMQEDREITDLTGITEGVDPSEGFEKMTENMVQVQVSGDKLKQHMIDKVMDPMGKSAYKNAEDMNAFKKALMLNPQELLPGYQEFAMGVQGSVNATLSTGAFDDNFKTELKALQDFIGTEQAGTLKDQKGLSDKIDKLLKQQDVSFKEFIKVAAASEGSVEVFNKAAELLKIRADDATAANQKILDDPTIQKQIEQKELIPTEEIERRQREEFMATSGRQATELEYQQQRQAEQQQQNQIQTSVQPQPNTVPQPQPTPAPPGNVNQADLNELDAELGQNTSMQETSAAVDSINNNTTQDAIAQAEQKEEKRLLRNGINNLKEEFKGFKEAFAGVTFVNNLKLDGKTVGSNLIRLDLGDGSRIAVVNASGDVV